MTARLREEGRHTARLRVGDRTLRVLYDATDRGLRLEVEGHTHFFAGQTAGQVRAGTPAMVVAVHVKPGDRVEVGQPLGVLEAMKMEISFAAPVAGVVEGGARAARAAGRRRRGAAGDRSGHGRPVADAGREPPASVRGARSAGAALHGRRRRRARRARPGARRRRAARRAQTKPSRRCATRCCTYSSATT